MFRVDQTLILQVFRRLVGATGALKFTDNEMEQKALVEFSKCAISAFNHFVTAPLPLCTCRINSRVRPPITWLFCFQGCRLASL